MTTSPVSGAELTPGGPSQSVAFTVTNPSTGSQTLSSVVVTVANADGSTWSVDDCSAADYTVSSLISYGVIAGGGAASGSVTIAMVNAPTNQDDCQGVDVPLYIEAG